MKKGKILLISSLAVVMNACSSGSSGNSNSSNNASFTFQGMACAINYDIQTEVYSNYLNNSPSLTVIPDPTVSVFLPTPASQLFNALAVISGSLTINEQNLNGTTIAYSVLSTPQYIQGNPAAALIFVNGTINGQAVQVPQNACMTGMYLQSVNGRIESAVATLTKCNYQPATAGQIFNFTSTYNITANGSIPASSGSFNFSCTPENR